MGSCRMLNKTGDITFAWTEDQDEAVAAVIQKKMDQGIRFFIVKPFADGEEIQITNIGDIAGREVKVHDEDFAKLLTDGRVGIFSRVASIATDMIRRVTDAREAARANTMAVRQPAGG
jgi:hypothetical protein